MKRPYFLPLFAIIVLLFSTPAVFAQSQSSLLRKTGQTTTRTYEQLPALIDLRTTFSDGEYDPETLVRMAAGKGFSVIVVNDHDRVMMEYGLPPLRNLLKVKKELNSIHKTGAKAYLRTIEDLRNRYPQMILIPGTESAPFTTGRAARLPAR